MLTLRRDNVLVKVIQPPSTTEGGIALPDAARDPEPKGIVIAHGLAAFPCTEEDVVPPEVGIDPTTANRAVGKLVWFSKYGGEPVTYCGQQYVLLKDEEILGFVPETDLTEGEKQGMIQ